MEKNSFKNMIVLKSLPSNLIEEAIVIFKDSVSIKSVKEIELNNKVKEKDSKENEKSERTEDNDFAVKEAELIVNDFARKIEEENKKDVAYKYRKKENREKKYKKLKIYSIVVTIFFLIENLVLLCR